MKVHKSPIGDFSPRLIKSSGKSGLLICISPSLNTAYGMSSPNATMRTTQCSAQPICFAFMGSSLAIIGAVKPLAVVVGAGPNGLTAAARLAVNGWRVEVLERSGEVGGAASTQKLYDATLVDLGAACHPFGAASPAFRALRLEDYGVRWLRAPYEMAHPLLSLIHI